MNTQQNYQHERRTILSTIHGSHLYGLAHANSDRDFYEAFLYEDNERNGYPYKKYARQRMDHVTGEDGMSMHLNRFLQNASEGSPQALEALFSDHTEFDPAYEYMLRNFRPNRTATLDRYRRTILNFAFNHGGRSASRAQRDSTNDRFKLARHSLRLTLNLNDFMRFGRFNPTLSENQAQYITTLARIHGTPLFERRLRSLLDGAMLGELRSL